MKYFIIYSQKNTRGIWVSEDDVDESIHNDFHNHKKIKRIEITQEEYEARINGNCGY
jgi:hypothetical protein|tara:strand:- start:5253 stop:5423 length:171 start_codon:yes stop_codon:yes gene_type:complete